MTAALHGSVTGTSAGERISMHVFLTPALHETRFLREASALLDAGICDRVVLVAKWDPGLEEEEAVADRVVIVRPRLRTYGLPRRLPWQLFKAAEWSARVVGAARRWRPSAIVAHSLSALSPSIRAARPLGIPVLYDAHELETERNGLGGLRQRLERILERRWVAKCDAVYCVSDSIADWYQTTYQIERPTVVRNFPDHRKVVPPRDRGVLRGRLNVSSDALVFLYQGALFTGRRLEQFVRVFQQLPPDRHLVVMGYGELEPMVRAAAATHPNIHFIPAVPPSDVLAHTAGADAGLVGVERVCLSYFFSLPNKLFEYLHAGVPVIAPSYPEIARIVSEAKAGSVIDESDDSWRQAILAWRREDETQLEARATVWRAQFSWNSEAGRFVSRYRAVLSAGAARA